MPLDRVTSLDNGLLVLLFMENATVGTSWRCWRCETLGRRCRAAMLSTMAQHGAASFARRAMSPTTCPATSPKLKIASCDIASDMSAHRQRCRQRQRWTFRDIADNGITCRQRHGAM